MPRSLCTPFTSVGRGISFMAHTFSGSTCNPSDVSRCSSVYICPKTISVFDLGPYMPFPLFLLPLLSTIDICNYVHALQSFQCLVQQSLEDLRCRAYSHRHSQPPVSPEGRGKCGEIT